MDRARILGLAERVLRLEAESVLALGGSLRPEVQLEHIHHVMANRELDINQAFSLQFF